MKTWYEDSPPKTYKESTGRKKRRMNHDESEVNLRESEPLDGRIHETCARPLEPVSRGCSPNTGSDPDWSKELSKMEQSLPKGNHPQARSFGLVRS